VEFGHSQFGHLWSTQLGEKGDLHFGPLHIASYIFLGYGFYLLSNSWHVLNHAQRRHAPATEEAAVWWSKAAAAWTNPC